MKRTGSKEPVLFSLTFFILFHTSKNGLSHTEGAGVTQTEVGGVTHTAFGVQGAPQMGLLLKPYFKTDGEHSARIVEGEFAR